MAEEIINLQDYHCYVLRDEECYFNWIGKEFGSAEAKERLSTRGCMETCSNNVECRYCCFAGKWRDAVEPTRFLDEEEDDESITRDRGHFHKFVSWNGEMVFLETLIGEYEKAERRLDYLNTMIDDSEKQHVRLDYMDGYKYICDMLGAFIKFIKVSLNHHDRTSLRSFNELSPLAQICVLSVKFLFVKESKESFETQIQILRKLILLEPTNAVWHEALGLRLRVVKNENVRSGRRTIKLASPEQSAAFSNAYKLRPDIPRFFAAISRDVAESWKNYDYQSLSQPIGLYIGNQSFDTIEGALNFLKKNTRFLLDVVDDIADTTYTAEALSTLGQVFSVSLPIKFRDMDLAEDCIKAAIRLNPTCSKSNHRMGLFQFFRRRNFESSLSYLASAIGTKMSNFYAVVDWIQILIHQADQKSKTLNDIFENIFSAEFKWTAGQTAHLTFLKGCFNFMIKGDNQETIDAWIQAYIMDEQSHHFSVTLSAATRFRWRGFDVRVILTLLTSSKRGTDPIVKKIVNEIRARGAMLKANAEFNSAKSQGK